MLYVKHNQWEIPVFIIKLAFIMWMNIGPDHSFHHTQGTHSCHSNCNKSRTGQWETQGCKSYTVVALERILSDIAPWTWHDYKEMLDLAALESIEPVSTTAGSTYWLGIKWLSIKVHHSFTSCHILLHQTETFKIIYLQNQLILNS